MSDPGLRDMATNLHVPGIDLVDNLKMSWKDSLKHAHWPALQSLGQEGVVSIGEGLGADAPGLIPAQLLEVHQNTHQFRDRHGRVSVIQLDGSLGGKEGVSELACLSRE